jgi:putative ABC transport system ATP-binding protein
MTAEENVAMPLALARVPSRESSRRAAEMLEAVGLGQRRHHRPNQLSGGEQQRVAIARALVGNPALLLADEPTGNLDSIARTLVMSLLREMVDQRGVTLLMVTHDPTCAELADREVRMIDGRWQDEQIGARGIPMARAV